MDTPIETDVAPPRKRWKRRVFIVAFAAFCGAWGFAFWYEAHSPKPEPLDAVSLHAATAACQSALASLTSIAPLPASPSVTQRTDRIHAEDTVFTSLVTDLDAIHPTDGDGAKALVSFGLDWQHLNESRERYAAALLGGEQRPKLVIPVDPTGAPVTIRMGEYARIHKLDDCQPDSLQGEVVEGARTYPRVQ